MLRNTQPRKIAALIPVLLLCCAPVFAQEMQTEVLSEAEGIEFFESKIRPVLVRECYGCHSDQSGQARGGLKLDTKMAMLLGGDSGPTLVPGSLEDSPLWSAINYEDYAMPPNKQLSADIIDDFRQWIEMGAPDPRGQEAHASINSTVTAEDIGEGREFWSFQRPRKPQLPDTSDDAWARGPIDQLVIASLEEHDMQPAADADPHTLLRRLCFDLIGLPPTPDQIDWFMSKWETDPDQAITGTVDRLLNSERFGERWGRHWLDVARYAESSGKEINATYPQAWRYRDYVIDSFNEDKPYDRFIEEQIAGDLLPVRSDEQWAENLIATGFLAIGPKTLTEQNPRQFRADLIDEQIDVSTRVILGVSVACARCHDHKFDPIPQSDYYAMAGIFGSMETYYGTLDTRQNRRPSDLLLLPIEDTSEFDKTLSADELDALRDQLAEVTAEYRELAQKRREARRATNPTPELQRSIREFAQTGARMAALQSVLDSYNGDGTPKTFCMGVQSTEPIQANLLVRGEVDQPAQEVPRGFVQVIGNHRKIRDRSTGRLELARWMSDEDNPLTARVMANRIWQHLIGKGIVETTENFGATGQPPTHPELLDYLALSFVENDWSIKQLIREIATSRTYRMSAQYNPEYYERDPDNKYLWRASPRRLEAEALRDAMLVISDKLDTERPRASEVARGGKTIVRNGSMRNTRDTILRFMNDDEMDSGSRRSRGNRRGRQRNPYASGNNSSTDPLAWYRSVYLPIVRDSLPRALEVFDFAESSMVVGRRETSNTPDQGLYFLNNPFVMRLSQSFAMRLMEHSNDVNEQIEHAFLLAWGRDATQAELDAALDFYNSFDSDGSGRERKLEKLAYLCQSLFAAAEFRIIN